MSQHSRTLDGVTFTIAREEPNFWRVSVRSVTVGFYRVNVVSADVSVYSHQRYLVGIFPASVDVLEKVYAHYRERCGRL